MSFSINIPTEFICGVLAIFTVVKIYEFLFKWKESNSTRLKWGGNMKKECTYLKSILVDDDIFGHPTYERYCELYKKEVLEIKCIKCKSRKMVE